MTKTLKVPLSSLSPSEPRQLRRLMHLRTVTGKGGGPEKTLLNSPRHLPDYDVRLLYIRPENDPDYNMPERAREMGVTLIDVPERYGFDPRTVFRLRREIRDFKPHILHAHDYKTNVLAILMGRWFGIPVVTTAHGNVSRGGRLEWYYRLDGWCYRRMRHVVVVSDDLRQYITNLEVAANRLTLIHNAIDTTVYRRCVSTEEMKRKLGMRSDSFLIGAIARLAEEKRFDVLIDAVARLVAGGMDVELVIAGDGSERERLQKQISEQTEPGRFHLLGYRSDAIDLLQALDVFALTSEREGLPNSLLEAMAMEVPVVATRIAGIPLLISHGKNGLMTEPGDVGELEQCLRRLLADAELRRSLAHEARRTIVNEYDFSARMQKVEMVYNRILHGAEEV